MCEPPDPATTIDGVAETLDVSADRLTAAARGVHAREVHTHAVDLRRIATRLHGIAGEECTPPTPTYTPGPTSHMGRPVTVKKA